MTTEPVPSSTPDTAPRNEAARWREKIRRDEWTLPTPGLAEGHAQANLLVLPSLLADAFERFCRENPRPCPLLERLPTGSPHPRLMARDTDLRTDVPRYWVFENGEKVAEAGDVRRWWCEDLTAFLLGCSFTFEWALQQAGLRLLHVEQNRNVAMYRTSLRLATVEPFGGTMVVSMRWFEPAQAAQAARISARFPRMHGAPVHIGDPAAIGIDDIGRPDFGDPVEAPPGFVPVFWPCGVTSQTAALTARPQIAICHAPGHMLLLDRTHHEFEENTAISGA
ncbi:MAG: putative hydro-lyase [Proteobacteria bacterium]|nr:putative hydro-lyase [Pseudomonadota bacterium]